MGPISTDSPEFEQKKGVKEQIENSWTTTEHILLILQELGKIMWDKVGMARNAED
jgi:succinate dehydrogenase / fumarate reductase flavoprotein subunit